ncbi:DHH family phosphoesterase [Patescibacteria group bacterium]|nr:DHH family phosphoesterase [Patescibacteria group bacterium]MCL5091620.1 DHH family phosphoesterase [Patescibacteria group bacterium]
MYPTNNAGQTIARIAETFAKNNAGVIVIPHHPSPDAVTAAAALYLSLTKLGKNFSLVCSSPVSGDFIGADKFQSTFATTGDSLVIALPYSEGAIDKVDYNIQNDHFNLIISPRTGYPKLNPNQVKYSYTGGTIDMIITIDATNLSSLGPVYADHQSQFQGKNLINIDRHITNAFFGSINYIDKTASSSCEMIYKVLQGINAEIDRDIASNLYNGIVQATNNFSSYSVNADTFETASQLLKAGAVKKAAKPTSRPVNQTFSVQPPFGSVQPTSLPASERQAVKPIEMVETQPQAPEGSQGQGPAQTANTPQDWLKPKIFRGSGLI